MADSTTTAPRDQAQHVLDPAIAALLPEQGAWSEQDYLWLTGRTNRLVELADGHIEVLPVPTEKHQAILLYLLIAFHTLTQQIGGKVFCAPLRLRLASGKFREPDLLLLRSAADPRRGDEYWKGADLVVEIVSPDDPKRDLVTKRSEYAEAGIPEYWIVDPRADTITVLRLADGHYVEHGVFGRGATATSVILPELGVSVDAVFDAE